MVEEDIKNARDHVVALRPDMASTIDAILSEEPSEMEPSRDENAEAGKVKREDKFEAASASLAEVVPGLSEEKRQELLAKAGGDVIRAADWALEELDAAKKKAQEEEEFQLVAGRNTKPSPGSEPSATPETVSPGATAAPPSPKTAGVAPASSAGPQSTRRETASLTPAAAAEGPKRTASLGPILAAPEKPTPSSQASSQQAPRSRSQPEQKQPQKFAADAAPTSYSASKAGAMSTQEEAEACDVLAMVAAGLTTSQRLRLLRAMKGNLPAAIKAIHKLSAGSGEVSDKVIALLEQGHTVESAVQAASQQGQERKGTFTTTGSKGSELDSKVRPNRHLSAYAAVMREQRMQRKWGGRLWAFLYAAARARVCHMCRLCCT